jgi:translation initiation factor 6 (eIF-6)
MMPPAPHQPRLSLENPETMTKSRAFVSRSTLSRQDEVRQSLSMHILSFTNMDFLHVGHKSKQSSRTMLLSSASMAAELEAIHDVNTKLTGLTACLQKHIGDITKLLKE